MGEHTFRSGGFRARETWTLDGTVLTGPEGSLELRHARNAQFAIMTAGRGFQSVELRFEADTGELGFVCTALRRSADLRASLGLAAEVAASYSRAHPGATFAPTTAARNQPWAVFAVALVAILVMLCLLIIGWVHGHPLGLEVGMESGLAILGAVVIWSAAPWRPRAAKTADEVRAWIEREH